MGMDDIPDPADFAEEFRRMSREAEPLHCPCGWSGEAGDAAIAGEGGSRDLSCPRCGQLLQIWTVEFDGNSATGHKDAGPDADFIDELDL